VTKILKVIMETSYNCKWLTSDSRIEMQSLNKKENSK